MSATQHRVAAARGPGRPARVELDSAGRSGRAGLGLLWGVRDVPPADPMSAPPFRLSLPGGQPGAEGPFVGTAHPMSKRPDGRVTRAARWQRLCGCSGDAEPGLGDCGGRGMVTGHWTVNQTHRWAWEGQRCPPARRGAGQRPWGQAQCARGAFASAAHSSSLHQSLLVAALPLLGRGGIRGQWRQLHQQLRPHRSHQGRASLWAHMRVTQTVSMAAACS